MAATFYARFDNIQAGKKNVLIFEPEHFISFESAH